jgi:hypothetical protein
MPESLARKVYQIAAQELLEAPALPMEGLFNNGVVQYRVGQIISDAVWKPDYEGEEAVGAHSLGRRSIAKFTFRAVSS